MARNGMMERRINWGLDDDLIARLRKGQHGHRETANHARRERHPFRRHHPVMTAFQPTCNGFKIGFILEVIAIHRMLGTLDDSLTDEVGRLEIHVGDPHGQHVGIAEDLLAEVIFHAVGISAVDDLVEIVFHC